MGALLDNTPRTNQEEVYALESIKFEVGTQRTFHYSVLIPPPYPWQTLIKKRIYEKTLPSPTLYLQSVFFCLHQLFPIIYMEFHHFLRVIKLQLATMSTALSFSNWAWDGKIYKLMTSSKLDSANSTQCPFITLSLA